MPQKTRSGTNITAGIAGAIRRLTRYGARQVIDAAQREKGTTRIAPFSFSLATKLGDLAAIPAAIGMPASPAAGVAQIVLERTFGCVATFGRCRGGSLPLVQPLCYRLRD